MFLIRTILADAKAATAIEYALIASLVSIAALGAMNQLGGTVANSFDNAAAAMAQ